MRAAIGAAESPRGPRTPITVAARARYSGYRAELDREQLGLGLFALRTVLSRGPLPLEHLRKTRTRAQP
jgi:hypothetical protein